MLSPDQPVPAVKFELWMSYACHAEESLVMRFEAPRFELSVTMFVVQEMASHSED